MHTELEQQVRFETLLADISSRFVNVPANAVDGEIMDAERRISEVLNLDIVSFWQWLDEGSGCFILTHCYNSQEGPRLPDQSNSMDLFPWFQREMRAGRIVSISSLDDLPPEAAPASALSAHELAVESGKKVLHGTDK